MTRMTGPDCAVMCNLINTHTHKHTTTAGGVEYHRNKYIFRKGRLNDTNDVNGVVIFFCQQISVDERLDYRVLIIWSHLEGLFSENPKPTIWFMRYTTSVRMGAPSFQKLLTVL